MTSSFLIYGANGYTGELTARFAVERGLHPVLAGRNAAELEGLANRLDLEHRIFGLSETEVMDHALSSVAAVLHCAGPFIHTHKQMAAACLRTATHYLAEIALTRLQLAELLLEHYPDERTEAQEHLDFAIASSET